MWLLVSPYKLSPPSTFWHQSIRPLPPAGISFASVFQISGVLGCPFMYFRKPAPERKRPRKIKRAQPEGNGDHTGNKGKVLKKVQSVSAVMTEARASVK